MKNKKLLKVIDAFIGEECANGNGITMKKLQKVYFDTVDSQTDDLDYVVGLIANCYRKEEGEDNE